MTGNAIAALFDVDGTLVDSNYLHAVTWWQAFAQAGHDVPMAAIHRAIGMGSDQLLDALLPPRLPPRPQDRRGTWPCTVQHRAAGRSGTSHGTSRAKSPRARAPSRGGPELGQLSGMSASSRDHFGDRAQVGGVSHHSARVRLG